MCYAIPGKLVEIKGRIGVVDYFGERRNVLIDLNDVSLGDFVYAQGGVLINKVSEREALETLETWKELFFELKKIDKKLAEVKGESKNKNLLSLLQKVNQGRNLEKEELLYFLSLKEKDELKLLFQVANNIRERFHGNACCVHGIIEFSNYCRNDCLYCGIRRSNGIERYRMTPKEIIEAARGSVENLGFKAIVLQSGEDLYYDEKNVNLYIEGNKKTRRVGIPLYR